MKRRHPLLLTLALATSALSVSAQTMKPGLWEMKNKMTTSSGEMEKAMALAQKEMAKMPADQRKMMEDMLAQQGMKMDVGTGATSIKVCMTPEMVARDEVAVQEGDCKQTLLPRVGNTMKFTLVCTEPPSTGEGQITFVSAEAYTMKMQVKTPVKGKTETMALESSAQFLSKNCGAIKPMGVPGN